MDSDVLFREILRTRADINSVCVPPGPGLYAIFLKDLGKLSLPGIPGTGLVYIGKSEDLPTREHKEHFCDGRTGSSTLRRTLGALLKDRLSLTAVPRGSGAKERDFTNYRFTLDGEVRLTRWMTEHLVVGVCSVRGDLEAAEKRAIIAHRPILCLKGWPNPSKGHIYSLRAACAEEARQNR